MATDIPRDLPCDLPPYLPCACGVRQSRQHQLEECGESKLWFSTPSSCQQFANASDTHAHPLNFACSKAEVRDEWIAVNTPRSEICRRQSGGQATRVDDRHTVGVDFDEHVATANRIVAVHERVDQTLSDDFEGEFQMLDAVEPSDFVTHREMSTHEDLRLLKILQQSPVQIFPIQNMQPFWCFKGDARDAGLRQKARRRFGEEKNPSVTEYEPGGVSTCYSQVDE